jgi:hypothetical protein
LLEVYGAGYELDSEFSPTANKNPDVAASYEEKAIKYLCEIKYVLDIAFGRLGSFQTKGGLIMGGTNDTLTTKGIMGNRKRTAEEDIEYLFEFLRECIIHLIRIQVEKKT